MPLPPPLIDIHNFLKRKRISLDTPMDDGRTNAAINEKKVISELQEHFTTVVKPPKARHWWDFSVQKNDEFYPVNIKITQMSGAADNMNCKLGMYYALTGAEAGFPNETPWETYLSQLSDHIKPNDKDYYFLVINKNDPQDVILQSLKTIRFLTPNGNNLPFQCVWEQNRDPTLRTFEDARHYLLGTLAQSARLRADMYFTFCRFFPRYMEDGE